MCLGMQEKDVTESRHRCGFCGRKIVSKKNPHKRLKGTSVTLIKGTQSHFYSLISNFPSYVVHLSSQGYFSLKNFFFGMFIHF